MSRSSGKPLILAMPVYSITPLIYMKTLPTLPVVKIRLFDSDFTLLKFGMLLYLVYPLTGWTEDIADNSKAAKPMEATFNSRFLVGSAQNLDISRFHKGNPILAGKYLLDIYLNGEWKSKKSIEFRNISGESDPNTCFTLDSLNELGVNTALLSSENAARNQTCRRLQEWIPQAFYRFDNSALRLYISMPQSVIRRNARGYVDPQFWDRGINAGSLSYNFNSFSTRASTRGSRSASTYAYLMLNAGLNLAGWQFRHNSNVNWRLQEKVRWQNTDNYVQRAIPELRGILTLGDSYTSGNFFDSMRFRGVQLATDDRMLPDSLNGYAPVVRGVAESNALVEIRQNRQLIYQTTVAPGEFVINDLYPTGYGGDLEVTVNEANGSKQQFSIPYSSVSQMLRPGMQRYVLTAGLIRDDSLAKKPQVLQTTYQRGFTNALTGYTGVTLSDSYRSVLIGNAVSTPIGAFALDVTQAQTRLSRKNRNGHSYKLSYSKLFLNTNSNVTVAAYRYSSPGYFSLQDAVYANENQRRGLNISNINRQNEYQLMVNQGLGQNYGSLYITGSWQNYWDRKGNTVQYQLGYNRSFGPVSASLSAIRTHSPYTRTETRYYLNFSMPLSIGSQAFSFNSSLSYAGRNYDSSRLGISGSTGEDNSFSYSATAARDRNGGTVGSLSGDYRTRFANINGSYSHGNNFQQVSTGASGSMVIHSGGVTMTPQRGDTIVLVEAPDSAGAAVTNAMGVRIDSNGYAVVPYVPAYRMTNIRLDPGGMSHDVELESSSQQVAPYAGAITHLKFKTRKGQALIIHARRQDGAALPFGAEVMDSLQQTVGIVGQGSRIYLRTEEQNGVLRVKWGTQPQQQCSVSYRIATKSNSQRADYQIIEARCR